MKELARKTGIFAEPSGAVTYAGLKKLVEQGAIKKDESVAIVVGGNGLKDIGVAEKALEISQVFVKPTLEEIEKLGLVDKK